MLSENVYFVWLKASEESSAASTPRNSSEGMGRGEEARGGRVESLEYLRVRTHHGQTNIPFLFLNFDIQAEAWKR